MRWMSNITGRFITKRAHAFWDMKLCWSSGPQCCEGKSCLHYQGKRKLPYTPPHNMFWLFFLVQIKATSSLDMSPATYSTMQCHIQKDWNPHLHHYKISKPVHHQVHTSLLLIPAGSQSNPVPSGWIKKSAFHPCPSSLLKCCMYFQSLSSHQLTLCADCLYWTPTTSMPLSSSVSSLSLLDDNQSSCRSGAEGPFSIVWDCMPDGPTIKRNQLQSKWSL